MVSDIGAFRRRTTCRVCGTPDPRVFLDLGLLPLAGGFLREEQLDQDRVYPLDVAVCRTCSLVQVLNVVEAHELFTDYRYLSSVTETLVAHFRAYADELTRRLAGRSSPLVVEMGCNDGVLLAPLAERGVRVLGIDPADNVTARARERGIEVLSGFFTEESAGRARASHGAADVITASNVFAHVDDLHAVMRGVDALLADDGIFAVEVHYVLDLLDGQQFDTIYHEHLCYYSLHALAALYRQHGFELEDVERLSMHGGAIRVFARRSGTARPTERLAALLEVETARGLTDEATYASFGDGVVRLRDRIRSLLLDRVAAGRTLSGYGAAGRATILLNYCGIDRTMMSYIVDASPYRAGWYVPGVHIPVVLPAQLSEAPTDDCLVTAWNYRDEILRKERAYLAEGGRAFIIPLPELEVVQGA